MCEARHAGIAVATIAISVSSAVAFPAVAASSGFNPYSSDAASLQLSEANRIPGAIPTSTTQALSLRNSPRICLRSAPTAPPADLAGAARRGVGQDADVLFPQFAEERVREAAIFDVEHLVLVAENHQPLRARDRQRLQYDRPREREDRRVGCQRDYQREHRDRGEHRAAPHHAEGLTKVVPEHGREVLLTDDLFDDSPLDVG